MRPLLLLSLVLPLTVFAQQSEFPRQLDLFVSGEQLITIPNLQKVTIADAAIAEVITIGNEVLVVGSSAGQTTLRVWQNGAPAWVDVKVVVTQSLLVKPASVTEVVLTVGEEKILSTPAVARIAVGDSDIADISATTSNSLTVKGAGEGTTTLIWWGGTSRNEVLVRVVK